MYIHVCVHVGVWEELVNHKISLTHRPSSRGWAPKFPVHLCLHVCAVCVCCIGPGFFLASSYIFMYIQIVCQSCGHVSEREEEFLDIPVALTGRTRLEQALKEMYMDTELLEGANQYRCTTCDRLVDAKRVCGLLT